MKHLRTEISIDASAEQVWGVLTDLERFSEWNPFITRASGEVRQGGRLEIFMEPPGGKAMGFKPTLMTVDPNRELRWVGVFLHKTLFTGQHYFLIEPQAQCQATFVQGEYFGGIMLPLMGAVLRKTVLGFDEMNHALKARVEAGS